MKNRPIPEKTAKAVDDPPQPKVDYEVGYKRPPIATRFKSPFSGNKKGRPKGAKNNAKIWNDELELSLTLVENGKRTRMPKRQAIIKQQINKSLNGDPKAAALVIGQMNRLEAATEPGTAVDLSRLQSPELIANIVQRIRKNAAADVDLTPAGTTMPGTRGGPDA